MTVFRCVWHSLRRTPSGSLEPSYQETFFSSRELAEEFLFAKRRALEELFLTQVLTARVEEVEVFSPVEKSLRPNSPNKTRALFAALPKNSEP